MNNDKVKGALAKAKLRSMEELLGKSTKDLQQVLPKHMHSRRLVGIALSCIRQNPELAQCNPASFVGALLTSAQLGIEPLAGQAYILPFWNGKTQRKEAQFLIGYRGLAELFYRHQKAIQLAWGTVRTNDEFEFEYGTSSYLRHRPTIKDPGEVLGYYVIAELQGGAKPFMWMSKEECMAHGRQHSKTYNEKVGKFSPFSPWATDPDAMCKKTVLIQLVKLLPLSIELQQAIGADETSREYREGIDNALDIPVSKWNGAEVTGNGGQPVKEPPPIKAPQPKKKEEPTYTVRPGKPESQNKPSKAEKKATPTPTPYKKKKEQEALKTAANGKDAVASGKKLDVLARTMAGKVIGLSEQEARTELPRGLKNHEFAELLNYLFSQKEAIEVSEWVKKLGEVIKGGRRAENGRESNLP